jgi:hypothetical protein
MAFSNEAVSFCFLLNRSDFVVPILYLYIAILRYNFMDSATDVAQGLSEGVAQGPEEGRYAERPCEAPFAEPCITP